MNKNNENVNFKKIYGYIIISLVFLLLSITILMQSPLNPMSKAMSTSDSSVFIYGSNLIREGKILYKDFFDHKGPVLYVIELIGLSMTNGNRVGIWIVEVIFMFINLCLVYKISRLFSKNKVINVFASIISVIPLGTFLYGGNFAEEYALPFIIYSLYTFIKFIKNGSVTYKEIGINGFCLGTILFLKPNLISLWIAFIPVIMFIYIRDKKYKELGKTIGAFSLGMSIVILPIIIYFLANNAFDEFIDVFISFNIKYSKFNKEMQGISGTVISMLNSTKLNIIVIVILILNCIRLKINKKKFLDQVILLLYLILTIILNSIAGRMYPYYGIVLIPCYIVPITELLEYIVNLNNEKIKIVSIIAFVLIIFLALHNNIQKQIEEIMHTLEQDANINMDIVHFIEENSTKNDSILALGNNCNIYLKSDRRYNGKYIYQVPIITIDERIAYELIENIENTKPKIIIYASDYRGFSMQKYTSPEELYVYITGEEGTIQDKELYESLSEFVKGIKNISLLYERIEEMAEEGIYEETINDTYISWKLKEN